MSGPTPSEGTSAGGAGRFPGFDVLAQRKYWDETTARVVLARLDPDTSTRFFDDAERTTASALFDLLLDQRVERKVPVLELVEQRLAAYETDGWYYADMPEDQPAWHATLAALEADAKERYGRPFPELDPDAQNAIVQAVQDADQWRGLPAGHVWSLWTRYACAAFYSHPLAWNEIGFGGPAYPRGYKGLGVGKLEPWERPDAVGREVGP